MINNDLVNVTPRPQNSNLMNGNFNEMGMTPFQAPDQYGLVKEELTLLIFTLLLGGSNSDLNFGLRIWICSISSGSISEIVKSSQFQPHHHKLGGFY